MILQYYDEYFYLQVFSSSFIICSTGAECNLYKVFTSLYLLLRQLTALKRQLYAEELSQDSFQKPSER